MVESRDVPPPLLPLLPPPLHRTLIKRCWDKNVSPSEWQVPPVPLLWYVADTLLCMRLDFPSAKLYYVVIYLETCLYENATIGILIKHFMCTTL